MHVPTYRFAGFSLDPSARELRTDGRLLRLPASAFDCLTYLVRQRQRAVGRDELIAAVWGRADVSEKLLGQTMVRIRRALGDAIDEPRFIRTVARFGYRWIAETEEAGMSADSATESAPVATAAVAAIAEPATAAAPATPAAAADHVEPIAARTHIAAHRPWLAYVAVTIAVLAGIGAAWGLLRSHPDRDVAISSRTIGSATLNVVMPAEVHAADEWSWLRLGLMDFVATRLRRGGITTLNSESVVGLLARAPSNADFVDGLPPHALQILPSATLDGDSWIVRLDASGKDGPVSSEARSSDALDAARAAVDALLQKLGHAAPDDKDAPPRALGELLQRAYAAALAERFQYAANLIDQAPAALREAPEVDVLRATLEIRSGSYAAAESRLRLLLDHKAEAITPTTRARALNALGAIHVREDRADEAGAEYTEAIEQLAGQREPTVLGYAWMGLGMIALMHDDFDGALADLGRARVEMEAAGNELGNALVELYLAQVQLRQRHPAEALATLRAAEPRLDRYSAREELVYARLFESEAQLRLLDPAGALAVTDAFWPVESATGNERLRWRLVLARANALAANGRLAETDALIERIRAESDAHADAELRLEATSLAADIAYARGHYADAARLAAEAATPALEDDDHDLYLRTRLTRLRSLIGAGQREAAASENAQLQTWLGRHDDAWHRAYASFAEAELAHANVQDAAALQRYADAAERIHTNGQPQDVVAITQPYVLALIDAAQLDKASAVIASLGAFVDSNLDVAWAEARLYAALGRDVARQRASERAVLLAGERALPAVSPPTRH